MGINFELYVIMATDQNGKRQFYYVDRESGHGSWGDFEGAYFFTTKKNATDAFESAEFNQESHQSNGKVYPPRMIETALDLTETNKPRKGSLRVMQVCLDEVAGFEIEAYIYEPEPPEEDPSVFTVTPN